MLTTDGAFMLIGQYAVNIVNVVQAREWVVYSSTADTVVLGYNIVVVFLMENSDLALCFEAMYHCSCCKHSYPFFRKSLKTAPLGISMSL